MKKGVERSEVRLVQKDGVKQRRERGGDDLLADVII